MQYIIELASFLKCKGKSRGYIERQEIVTQISEIEQMTDEELNLKLSELRNALKN